MIAAVIVGLTAAKFVEAAGLSALPDGAEPTGASYQVLLVAGWGLGAFAAALTALLLGRRWAPLAWLAAACMFFAAAITTATFALGWAVWPASAAVTALGGFAAVRLLRASNALPMKQRDGLFHD